MVLAVNGKEVQREALHIRSRAHGAFSKDTSLAPEKLNTLSVLGLREGFLAGAAQIVLNKTLTAKVCKRCAYFWVQVGDMKLKM